MAKVAVQCFEDSFMVNQILVSTSIFLVKIATFAKPETCIYRPYIPCPKVIKLLSGSSRENSFCPHGFTSNFP